MRCGEAGNFDGAEFVGDGASCRGGVGLGGAAARACAGDGQEKRRDDAECGSGGEHLRSTIHSWEEEGQEGTGQQ